MNVLLAFILVIAAIAAFVLRVSRKIKGALIAAAVVFILYSALLSLRPIYIPPQPKTTDPLNHALAGRLIRGTFNYYLLDLAGEDGIVAYKIKSADLETFEGKTLLFVHYDVKPTFLSYSEWMPGNGRVGENGWLTDKTEYYECRKHGNFYYVTGVGTGL